MVSIIIVSYNTKEVTRQCLVSVEKYVDLKQHEVLVVDNGSTDGSVEMLEKDFSFVKLIKNSANWGFAKANNQAIRIAKGEFVLLLNSDTELQDKHTIEQLISVCKQQPDVGAVVPKLLNSDGSDQASVFHFPTLTRAIREYWLGRKGLFDKYVPRANDQTVAVEVAVMAAMLIPRKTIDQVGLLDEGYFMFFEDLDYCRRIHRADLKVFYVPTVQVIHHHGASGKQTAPDRDQWRRLVPGSKRYHGLLRHYLITAVLWSGQKVRNFSI